METRLGAYIKVITTQRAASCAINHKGELTRDSGEERRIFVINKTSAGHPISRDTTEQIDPQNCSIFEEEKVMKGKYEN